jgi:hypothetical protein
MLAACAPAAPSVAPTAAPQPVVPTAAAAPTSAPVPAVAQLPAAVVAYPQLILFNGKVLTMDRDDDSATVAEALAIRDGKILAVGTTADIPKLAGPQTTQQDLAGKTVIPGIIDTHTHLMDYALDDYAEKDQRALRRAAV